MAAKEVRLRPSRPSRPVAALVLALLASSAAARADGTSPAAPAPPTPLESALAAKEWSRALPLAEEAAEGAGQAFAEALYRVARVRAFLGQRTEALDALERAHGAGLFNVSALRKDEAFVALADDARFQALAKAVWLKGYLWLLERKERDAYQKPDEVMRALALKPGERIADVGAGSGYFTLRLARAVGPSGSVLAVDANADLLAHLDGRLKQAGLTNARTLLVPKDDPQLPVGGLDTVLIVDTLHYVKDRAAWLRKVRAGLAPGGRVVVVDFVPKSVEERPWGPPPSQWMSREEVDASMAEAGLVPRKVHDFLTEQFFVEYVAAP